LPEISGKLPLPGPPTSGVPAQGGLVTFADAEVVARLYRRLVLLVGLQLIVAFGLNIAGEVPGPDVGMLLVLVLFICAVVADIVLVVTAYRLMAHLGSGVPTLWAVAMFFPLVNVLVLLAISSRAQTWCRRYGIKVGLLGPTKQSLEELRAAAAKLDRS
jgi:hypothetical protein